MSVNHVQFQGPIPPPAVLAQYNAVEPGLVNRIVTMAEEQAKHRQSLEKSMVDATVSTERRGQWFALVIALFGLVAAGYCASIGQPVVSGLIASVDLVGLAGIFIVGKRMALKQMRERQEQEQEPESTPAGA